VAPSGIEHATYRFVAIYNANEIVFYLNSKLLPVVGGKRSLLVLDMVRIFQWLSVFSVIRVYISSFMILNVAGFGYKCKFSAGSVAHISDFVALNREL
jgi:hypothetical protein